MYIIVGCWNTFFGYVLYAAFTYLLERCHVRFSYMYAYIIGNFISVTQAFAMHKYVVFRSSGNFWREYKKCWLVYGFTVGVSFLMLPLFVKASGFILPGAYSALDKYLAGIMASCLSALISFAGHKNITFR
jgi:putative flippase GtrA